MRWMPAATGWFESGVRPVFIARRARSMVGGRRRNPRARQGADVQIGPAAKSSSPGCRDRGSGSHDPTGYEVGREYALSVRPELTETHDLALDIQALIRGFRTPALTRRLCGFWGRCPKASQGGNRGEVGGW